MIKQGSFIHGGRNGMVGFRLPDSYHYHLAGYDQRKPTINQRDVGPATWLGNISMPDAEGQSTCPALGVGIVLLAGPVLARRGCARSAQRRSCSLSMGIVCPRLLFWH